MKMLGKMGLRDQNNGKRIGINGSWIYHVTTLLYSTVYRLRIGEGKRWNEFAEWHVAWLAE